VTADVEPYSIVAGNPAKVVGKRFSSDEVLRHETALYGGR
jgi:acetyltransferase-like isoleucine patch superfamily enzyme